MTAPGLNYLNYVGALRKNKNATIDEEPSVDVTPFEFDRFKRHLTSLLERVSRMSTNDHKASGSDDMSSVPEPVAEEDDSAIESANGIKPKKKDEESDWVFDVEKTIDALPRLVDDTDYTNDNNTNSN